LRLAQYSVALAEQVGLSKEQVVALVDALEQVLNGTVVPLARTLA